MSLEIKNSIKNINSQTTTFMLLLTDGEVHLIIGADMMTEISFLLAGVMLRVTHFNLLDKKRFDSVAFAQQ